MSPIIQHLNEPRASYLLRVAAQTLRHIDNNPLYAQRLPVCDNMDNTLGALATTLEAEASDLMHAAGCPEADSVIRPGQVCACGKLMSCAKSEGFDESAIEVLKEEWSCTCGNKRTIQGRRHAMEDVTQPAQAAPSPEGGL
jgi:hypothetical protein